MKANKLIFFLIILFLTLIVLFVPIKPNLEGESQSLIQLVTNITGIEVRSEKPKITIILGGDVMLGRTVMTASLDRKDPTYPFHKISLVLEPADIVFVNLENPFVTGCKRDYEGLIFCADPSLAQGLAYADINVVSLANNHSRNYGQEGINETVGVLASYNIEATGLGGLITKEVQGIKFGFLGFDFLSAVPKEEDYQLIRDSRSQVDVLIVSVHWGVEYSAYPTNTQRAWAEELVNAGADVIMGHHPHWVQEIGDINDHPVYYSLGNFVFDQMWSQKTREGLLIRLTYNSEGKLIKEEPLKLYMNSWAQPELIEK